MRVYIPATIDVLRSLVADREFLPAGRTAFAVTPALREAYSSGDDDELSEVAMSEAALASLRLLSAHLDGPRAAEDIWRRVVVAADAVADPRPDLDDAVVKVPEPIQISQVASVHVDLAEASVAIKRAAEAIDAADLGDIDAGFVVSDAEDQQLAWYAASELSFFVELL